MQTHPAEILRKAFLKELGKTYDNIPVRDLPVRLGLKGLLGAETIRKAFQVVEPITVSDENYITIARSINADVNSVLMSAVWWRLPRGNRKHIYLSEIPPEKIEKGFGLKNYIALSKLIENLEIARGNNIHHPKGLNKWFLSESKDEVFSIMHETLVYNYYTENEVFNYEEAALIKQEMDLATSKEGLDKSIQKVLIHTTKKIGKEVDSYLKQNSIHEFRFTSYFDKIFDAKKLIKYLDSEVSRILSASAYVPNRGDILELGKTPLFNVENLYKEIAETYIPSKRLILISGSYGAGKTLTAAVSVLYYLNCLINNVESNKDWQLKIPLLIELRNEYNPNIIQLCQQTISRIIKREINHDVIVKLISFGFIIPIIDGIDELAANGNRDFVNHFKISIKQLLSTLKQDPKSRATIILSTRENLFQVSPEKNIVNSLSDWLWNIEPDSVTIRISNFSEKEITNYQSSFFDDTENIGSHTIDIGIDDKKKSSFKILSNNYISNIPEDKDPELFQKVLGENKILSRPLFLYYSLKIDKNIQSKAVFFHSLNREYFMREWGKRENIKKNQGLIHVVLEKMAWIAQTSSSGYISSKKYSNTISDKLYNSAVEFVSFKNELQLLGVIIAENEQNEQVWKFEFSEFKKYYFYRYILRKILISKNINDFFEFCLCNFDLDDISYVVELLKTDVLDEFLENATIDFTNIKKFISSSVITAVNENPKLPYSNSNSYFERLQIPFGGFENIGSILSILISIAANNNKLGFVFKIDNEMHRTIVKFFDFRHLKPVCVFEKIDFIGVPFDFSYLYNTKFVDCTFDYCSFLSVESSEDTFDESCSFTNIFGEAPNSTTEVRSFKELIKYADTSMTFINTKESNSENISPFLIDNMPAKKSDYLEFYKKNSDWHPDNIRNLTGLDYFLYEWNEEEVKTSDDVLVYVNFEASAAFAKWNGKRLPTNHEWDLIKENFSEKNSVDEILHWILDTDIHKDSDGMLDPLNLENSLNKDPEHIGRGKVLERNNEEKDFTKVPAKNTNVDFGFRCVLPVVWLLPIIANAELSSN